MSPYQLLLIDDEHDAVDALAAVLRREGFDVSVAYTGEDGLQQARAQRPDVLVLDILLPGMDGRAVCRALRAAGDHTPIIMLTAISATGEKIHSLEEGADDYLDKPFDPYELIARIRAVLRRGRQTEPAPKPAQYRFDRWRLDTAARELIRDDNVTIALSTGEYDLLLAFVERPQRVLTREQLLDLARGRAAANFDRAIDTQVSRLRKKIEQDPADPKIIKTVWGGGYTFPAVVTEG
jgi:two-component system OmpR family response regulator